VDNSVENYGLTLEILRLFGKLDACILPYGLRTVIGMKTCASFRVPGGFGWIPNSEKIPCKPLTGAE
jgi:hypothetical protein